MNDLEKASQEYSFMIPTEIPIYDLGIVGIWKKETEQHFKDGAEWNRRELITKTESWLRGVFRNYDEKTINDLVEEFKRVISMENLG